MARKKRRRKSRSKKKQKQNQDALNVSVASEVSGEIEVRSQKSTGTKKADSESKGVVSGELTSITSGEIVVTPEKGLDVTFGVENSSGIIVDEGVAEVMAEARNEHKVVGEIVVDHSGSKLVHQPTEEPQGIVISGEGVIVEEPDAPSEGGGVPESVSDTPTEELPTKPVAGAKGAQPTESGEVARKSAAQESSPTQGQRVPSGPMPVAPGMPPSMPQQVVDASAATQPSVQEPPPPPPPPPEESPSSPYVLSEEEHAALLRRKHEQEKTTARLMHAMPSPFALAEDLRAMHKGEVEADKFADQTVDRPSRELKLESLRDLVPPKPSMEGEEAPVPKARPERKRRSSGSMTLDAAFTDEERAFFEEDLDDPEDDGSIQEIFEQMDANARKNQRGWLDSLKDLIAPSKADLKKSSRRRRSRRPRTNGKKKK